MRLAASATGATSATVALNRRRALGNLHGEFGADFDVADECLGHVGLEAKRSRIFHFDDGFSGCSEIADISQFARDDSIKRRNDLRVAEHRLHLSCRSFGDPRPRLHGVEIRLRRDFFVEQFATAGEVARRLLAQGERLIELGLNLARIELCDQIPGLHHLSGGDEQRFDPGTYFWFDRGAKFCPHRSDDFLARRTRLIFDHDGADRDRRQRFGRVLLFGMTRDRRESGDDREKRTRELHRRLLWRDAALFASTADAQLDENALERAETGEGGLEKVEPNKGREKQPELVHPISEREPG